MSTWLVALIGLVVLLISRESLSGGMYLERLAAGLAERVSAGANPEAEWPLVEVVKKNGIIWYYSISSLFR